MTSQLGPFVGATLLTKDIGAVVSGYQTFLNFTLERETTVSQTLSDYWQAPKLVGAPMAILSAANNEPWLRVVEDRDMVAVAPLKRHGWMALEINVADVSALREKFPSAALANAAFDVIGEPAYLQISDAIKAMQVIGPANEVSYLTQIEKPVPPFELPMTEYETGNLFIPVLSTPNRDDSLNFYQALNLGEPGLKFETKITVLNKAWQRPLETQYPVATLQIDGKCLFEIDQVTGASPLQTNEGSLPSGIAIISCRVKDIDRIARHFDCQPHNISDDYYQGCRALFLTGPSGEKIELIG